MAVILVIDDDPVITGLVKDILETKAHRVIEATDGELGLELFYEHGPEIVIVDLFMPKKEGIEAIRDIRRACPATKIVAMSAGWQRGMNMLSLAEDFGASAILYKPFRPADLVDAVAACLPGS